MYQPPKGSAEASYHRPFNAPIRDLRRFPGDQVYQLDSLVDPRTGVGRGQDYAGYLLYQGRDWWSGFPELTVRSSSGAALHSYAEAVGWAHRVGGVYLAEIVAGRR